MRMRNNSTTGSLGESLGIKVVDDHNVLNSFPHESPWLKSIFMGESGLAPFTE